MARRTSAHRKRRPPASHRHPPGTPAGTLHAVPGAPVPVIDLLAYGPDGYKERRLERWQDEAGESLAVVREAMARWPVVWLNVAGLGDEQTIAAIGAFFSLHRLALEDVVHLHQRTKLEQYGEHVYIVLRLPEGGAPLDTEQISLFVGHGFLVTFEERLGGCFDLVRERVRAGKGNLRALGADYLAYALLDVAIDSHFPVLERIGELLEDLEDILVVSPSPTTIGAIHAIKRDLITMRRAIWPLRETLAVLSREPNPLFHDEARLYLRDCHDHTVQIIELLESYREIASGLLDVYLSSVNNRMNEIMKVLTIIATIFMPLSFIASVYGMNFDTTRSPWNMPELGWRYGYPFALGLMAGVAVTMLSFFRRRGWLGQGSRPGPQDDDLGGQSRATTSR